MQEPTRPETVQVGNIYVVMMCQSLFSQLVLPVQTRFFGYDIYKFNIIVPKHRMLSPYTFFKFILFLMAKFSMYFYKCLNDSD